MCITAATQTMHTNVFSHLGYLRPNRSWRLNADFMNTDFESSFSRSHHFIFASLVEGEEEHTTSLCIMSFFLTMIDFSRQRKKWIWFWGEGGSYDMKCWGSEVYLIWPRTGYHYWLTDWTAHLLLLLFFLYHQKISQYWRGWEMRRYNRLSLQELDG